MFPHERSLVKRLRNRPFAIVGVNTDKDPKVLKQKNKQAGITWRSFWCGAAGGSGAIPRAWNIEGYPTLILIDATGKIRQRWLGNPGEKTIDAAVEKVVQEAEAAKG